MKLLVAGILLGTLFLTSCGEMSSSTGSNDQTQSVPVSSDDPAPPITDESNLSVIGRVTDEIGEPLAGASVTVRDGTAAVPEVVVLTNAAGDYQWDLPVGTFSLAVFADGYVMQEAKVVVSEGVVVRQDFVLQKAS